MEILGVDTDKGLSVCGGDSKIYQTVLRSYAVGTSAVLEKMRNVTEETLPAYRIAVHGLKGASANIGAEAIRQTAAKLEEMAEVGNLSGILDQNDALLHETENLVADIKAWFERHADKADKTAKPQLPESDRGLLDRLRRSCEHYDHDGANNVMTELEKNSYENGADLIIWLREKIDTLDFDEIVERLAEYHDSHPMATSHTEH
jgi:HPt (histidine-containing phosphotransfer) domain-containing protein